MRLVFSNQTAKKIPKSHLESVAKKLATYLKRKGEDSESLKKEVVMVFLDPKPARELNKQFRKKDYATDVLSFSSADPECLGELVLCPTVLERQASENGHSYKWELTYMFIHGVLHLLGHDHELGEKEAQMMFALQDKFFESLLQSR